MLTTFSFPKSSRPMGSPPLLSPFAGERERKGMPPGPERTEMAPSLLNGGSRGDRRFIQKKRQEKVQEKAFRTLLHSWNWKVLPPFFLRVRLHLFRYYCFRGDRCCFPPFLLHPLLYHGGINPFFSFFLLLTRRIGVRCLSSSSSSSALLLSLESSSGLSGLRPWLQAATLRGGEAG